MKKTTMRTIKTKGCPLCGSPVTAEETLKAFEPSINPYSDKWFFNARFTAKCKRCFCTLDVADTYDDDDLNNGERFAEEFFRMEERLWNREETKDDA